MTRALAGFCFATVTVLGCKASFDRVESGADSSVDSGESAEGGESSESEAASESTGGDEGPRFVAVGGDYTVHTSLDGSGWTDRTPSLPIATGRLGGVAHGNGAWVAIGGVGDTFSTVIMRSEDGESFDLVPSALDTREGVMFGGDHFVAYGFDSARSSDGLTWQSGTAFDNLMTGVAFGGGVYVAVGASAVNGSAASAVSSDGLSWSEVDDPGDGFLKVAYGDDSFVAVGFNGRIAQSSDGLTWVDVADTGEVTTGVGHNEDNFFAAAGANHTLWTSPDGTSWTNTGVQAYDHMVYSPVADLYVGVSGDGSRGYTDDLSGFIATSDGAASYWAVAAR